MLRFLGGIIIQLKDGGKISLQSSSNAKTGETPHQHEDDEQHGTVEDGVTEALVEEESD